MKSLPCSCSDRIRNVEMVLLPKPFFKFSVIASKILVSFFTEIEKKS